MASKENPNRTTLGTRQPFPDAKGDRSTRARDDPKSAILRLAAESGGSGGGGGGSRGGSSLFRPEETFKFPEGYFDVPVTVENLLACRCLPPEDLEGFVEPLTMWEIVPTDEDIIPSLSEDVTEDFEVSFTKLKTESNILARTTEPGKFLPSS